MADAQYTASLDDSDVLKSLNRIEKAIKETGKTAERAFGKADQSIGGIQKSSLLAAGGMGALALAVTEVLGVLQQVSAVAAETFKDLIARGIELNSTFEVSGKVLGQALNDPELGQAAVKVVDELAEKFRANRGDAQAFAQSILPRSDSLETFSELLRLVDIQADTTGKSFDELGFSIREAISGDFVSLKDQFDIGNEEIARIKELSAEIGPSAALAKVLADEFDRLGKTDVASGTFAGSLKDLRIAYDNFAERVGAPVFEELKDQINAVLSVISENQEGINRTADALGDLAAAAARLIGTELTGFIDSLDFASIEQGIDNITRLVNAISGLIDIALFGFRSGALQIAFGLSTGNAALAGAGFVKAVSGEYESLGDVLARISEEQTVLEKDLQQAISDRGKAEKDVTDDIKGRIDAQLGLTQAMKDLGRAESDIIATQEKIADQEDEILRRRENSVNQSLRALVELEIKQGEARTEALIRQSEDRVQAERDNARERESILFKFNQDLNRLQSQDDGTTRIARENGRKRAEVDRDLANERIQIERDYQNEIRRIQQSFEQSAVSAASNVDAQAFLAAQRQRDNDLQSARVNRENQVADAEIAAQQQREALKVELQNEIADAREAHQQKLADLRQRLEDELAAQAFKEQQDAQRQAEIDAQELVRLDRQQALELERFNRSEAEKQLRLEESLQKQVDALSEAKQKEIDLTQQAEKLKADIAIAEAQRAQAEISRIQRQSSVARTNVRTGRTSGVGGGIPVLHSGGPLQQGETALVRRDETFFTAPSNGFVATPEQFRPAAALFGGGGGNQTTNNNTINAGLTPNMINDPEMQLMVRKMVNQAIQGLLG